MVLDPNKDVMENLVTIVQGRQRAMMIISLLVKNEIISYIHDIDHLT
jgi:hypothetical protein